MYKNHTAVLYDDTAGGVCFFCWLFNVKCFLKSAVSAVSGVNIYDADKSLLPVRKSCHSGLAEDYMQKVRF